MVPDHVIEEIKNRIDIVEIIGDYVNLKKAGNNYRALSPFNQERTPSFFVVPHKGFFKDFSSGKSGDAITFLMEMEGMSYLEVMKELAKRYGIEYQEQEPNEEALQQQNEKDSLYILLNFTNQYYQQNLWEDEEGKSIGLSYFRERGFSDEIITQFGLGYSLDKWDGLLKTARKHGYSEELLEKAGLISKKTREDNSVRYYDRFRGRVIFPIYSLSGKVIAFGGRILKPAHQPGSNKDDGKQPKYINSPETSIYHKSSTLYGIYQAKQAIRQSDNCYLVEGYTDVIAMHQAGVPNVVASSGTSLTGDQIKLIARFSKNITVLFDGDEAGIQASLRGIDMILEGGLNVKAVMFPKGDDPDSYARKLGAAGFRNYLEQQQQDFITFKIRLLADEAQRDPVKRAETIRDIVTSIAKIPDGIQRSVYTKECSRLLDVEESVLIAEQNKIHLREQQKSQKQTYGQKDDGFPPQESILDAGHQDEETSSTKETPDRIAIQERECIRLLISYGFNEIEESYHLYDYLLEEIEDIQFQTPVYKRILDIFKEKLKEETVIDANYLINNGDEEIKRAVIDMESMAEKYAVSENWHERFNIYIPSEPELLHNVVYSNLLRLKYRVLQKLIAENQEQMKNAPEEELVQKMKDHQHLKSSQMEIAKQLGIVIS